MAANSRGGIQKCLPSHLAKDANFHQILDRSAHNPEFLQTHDAYLTELLPDDVTSMREEGHRRHVGGHRVCR